MQQDNTFKKGLQTDTDPQFQPEDSYIFARNLLLNAGGNLQQERAPLPLNVGPNLPIVGGTALGLEEILFASYDGTSEIGVLRGSTYMTIVRGDFSLGLNLSATARIDYRGHRLVYWADGISLSWLDLDAPTTNIPEGFKLLPNPSLPLVDAVSVDSAGELPTGIYQASICLLSGSKNPISYSLFSGVVPIVDEPVGTIRTQLDGAPPQKASTGSINFHLSDLPTDYTYAQLIIATYTGVGNALQLFRLPLIPINGRSSLDYTYYSFSQHQEQVPLGDVLNTLADYNTATTLIQKDGRLVAANLSSKEPLAIDWQAIANSIVLGPSIKEVPFTADGADSSDYKNPLSTTHLKGFQRDEVYSFSFTPIVNGRRLDAYHIPGSPYYDSRAFYPYYSVEQYPSGMGYVADYNGNNSIRHHRMPSIAEQPLISNATQSGCTLRILGILCVIC